VGYIEKKKLIIFINYISIDALLKLTI
jgi:hypothetical protein